MLDASEITARSFALNAVELGEFAAFSVKPMKVTARRWKVEGLGGLTLMNARAAFGIMKMQTLVFTPSERDIPLFSWDIIEAMGKVTLLITYYDFPVSNKQPNYSVQREIRKSLENMKEYVIPSSWLDEYCINDLTVARKSGKKSLPIMEKAIEQSLFAYLEMARNSSPLTPEKSLQKKQLIEEYVDKLFSLGSPTTKVFVKAIGEEKSKEFYKNVMFCP